MFLYKFLGISYFDDNSNMKGGKNMMVIIKDLLIRKVELND